MRRAVKKKENYVLAYQLGADSTMEKQLIKEGAIEDRGDETYELFSQEAINGTGQIAHAEDYFKVITKGGKHYPYPLKKKWFEEHHRPINRKGMEDTYEQLNLPVEFFKLKDDEKGQEYVPSGTVKKLLDEQKLEINMSDPEKTFTATLDGAELSVPKDGVVVIYGTREDGSVDFGLMPGDTFKENYQEILCFNFATRTKGISDPGDITDMKEKQRLYFTCHPDDFDGCFEDIRKQIQDLYEGCAICFKTHPAEILDEEEQERLSDMDAFVIPVTEKFLLEENFAKKECDFADKKGIPVLFWLEYHDPEEHKRLLKKFQNGKFNSRHFYDREMEDNDANMFHSEEKLERFLSSCLLDDALLDKIKSSFRGNYIFLSYRRDDRNLARRLMGRIHEFDFCWDTAIWYDEFLVFGEKFDDKINEKIEESGLFVLAVTPKLLEFPNYIQEKEYPAAKAAYDKNKINILPVELEPTEWVELRKDNNYPGIEKPTGENDVKALGEKLSERAPQSHTPEKKADPNHLFYIGSAYLRGIDLEKNSERGVKLIKTAAKKGSLEAMERLARIYEIGEDTIDPSFEKEIHWRNKIKKYWKKKYSDDPSEKNAENRVEAYRKLGLAKYNEEHYYWAKVAFRKMLPVAKDLYENFPESQSRPEHCHTYWRSLMYIGLVCIKAEKWEDAEACFQNGLSLTEREIGPEDPRQYRVYNYYELGSVELHQREENRAEEWNKKAIALCEEMYSELKSDEENPSDLERTLNNLSRCYRQRGNIEKGKGRKDAATEWYQKAEEKQEERISIFGSPNERKYLAARYEKEGEALREKYQYKEAITKYEKGHDLRSTLANIYPATWEEWGELADCRMELCICYQALFQDSKIVNYLKQGKLWGMKALGARQEEHNLNKTSDIVMAELASDYYSCALYGVNQLYCLKEAEKLWENDISSDFPNRERYLKNVRSMKKNIEEQGDYWPLKVAMKERIVQVKAFRLGVGHQMEKDFIDEGLIDDLGNGEYRIDDKNVDISSWTSDNPMKARKGSIVTAEKINGKFILFPYNDKENFESFFSHVEGDKYETTIQEEVKFYLFGDDMAPVIQKLIDSGELIIDESDPEKTFTAKIGGEERSVAKDGVVVIFEIKDDGTIDFDLISAEEFEREYTDITDYQRFT